MSVHVKPQCFKNLCTKWNVQNCIIRSTQIAFNYLLIFQKWDRLAKGNERKVFSSHLPNNTQSEAGKPS